MFIEKEKALIESLQDGTSAETIATNARAVLGLTGDPDPVELGAITGLLNSHTGPKDGELAMRVMKIVRRLATVG